jgi:hypothetical protein
LIVDLTREHPCRPYLWRDPRLRADAVYRQEIENLGLYDAILHALAVLLLVRTVGVMSDTRTYDRDGLPGARLDPHRQRGAGDQPRGL